MPPKARIEMTTIEVSTLIPGVQVLLDLKQVALIRDLFADLQYQNARDTAEEVIIKDTLALFRGIGGMDITRGRAHLFPDKSEHRF